MSSVHPSPAMRTWIESGRYLQIAGQRIFTKQWGHGADVLLIHGFPTSSLDWRGVAERLQSRFRLSALDLLGFGASDKPVAHGYSLFEQADLVEAVAAELGLGPVHVVSHDLGTSVHCELLARGLEGRLRLDVRSSLFLNGSMLQWMAHLTPMQEMLATNARLPEAIELCRTSGREFYLPALKAIMRRPDALSEQDASLMQELLEYQDGYLLLPALAAYMRERYIHADRWLGAIRAARCPVQFLWADSDPIAHVAMGREMAARSPQASYVELADLGHFLMIEDPAVVAAEIARWLDAQTANARIG